MPIDSRILDADGLIADLRLAAAYGARAGVLTDKAILEAVQSVEAAISENQNVEVYAVISALNEVARAIAPITVADLRAKRDPFSSHNERKAGNLQFVLTLSAVALLVLISVFMHRLQVERQAIADINEVQSLQPDLKLTALRKLAQYEEPMPNGAATKPTTLYDEYYARVSELKSINNKISNTYASSWEAADLSLIPFFSKWFEPEVAVGANVVPASGVGTLGGSVGTAAIGSVENPGAYGGVVRADAPEQQIGTALGSFADELALQRVPDAVAADPAQTNAEDIFCAEDGHGNITPPRAAAKFPGWMRAVLADALGDYCFQLNVLSPDGTNLFLGEESGQISFLPRLKEKVEIRTAWFLPFLYGMLGSVIFLLRQTANVRMPAPGGLASLMRICLGGIAGIVIGWFALPAVPLSEITTTLSMPFALAFMTGYGIEALFTILDRINVAIGNLLEHRDPARTN